MLKRIEGKTMAKRTKKYKAEIYCDDVGEYRWRIIASNGNIVADSGEGYKTLIGAKTAILRLGDMFKLELVETSIVKK